MGLSTFLIGSNKKIKITTPKIVPTDRRTWRLQDDGCLKWLPLGSTAGPTRRPAAASPMSATRTPSTSSTSRRSSYRYPSPRYSSVSHSFFTLLFFSLPFSSLPFFHHLIHSPFFRHLAILHPPPCHPARPVRTEGELPAAGQAGLLLQYLLALLK